MLICHGEAGPSWPAVAIQGFPKSWITTPPAGARHDEKERNRGLRPRNAMSQPGKATEGFWVDLPRDEVRLKVQLER